VNSTIVDFDIRVRDMKWRRLVLALFFGTALLSGMVYAGEGGAAAKVPAKATIDNR